jgi:starvation-inducible outer membrane lipoprotein
VNKNARGLSMKKLILIALFASMSFTLVACGNSPENNNFVKLIKSSENVSSSKQSFNLSEICAFLGKRFEERRTRRN